MVKSGKLKKREISQRYFPFYFAVFKKTFIFASVNENFMYNKNVIQIEITLKITLTLCNMKKIVKLNCENILLVIWDAINGRFGNKVLKYKPRRVWKWFTYSASIFYLSVFIILPFFELLHKFLRFVNYVVWGY